METLEQDILTALQTKFPGVDAKILGRIAKAKAKTAAPDADAQTIANGVTTQQVLESYGDFRATEASQTAVKNYETKHNLKDGKLTEPAKPTTEKPATETTPKEDEVPAWAKSLIEGQAAINKRFEALDAEKTASARLDTFKKAIASAPERVRTRYERDFSRLTFKDDEDFNAYLEEIKPDIEAMANEAASKGGAVGQPKSGGGASDTVSPLVQARINEQKAATTSPAIIGLPTNPNPTA